MMKLSSIDRKRKSVFGIALDAMAFWRTDA